MPRQDDPSIVTGGIDRRAPGPSQAEIWAEYKRRRGIVDLDEAFILRSFRTRLRLTRLLFGVTIAVWIVVAVLERTGRLDVFWLLSLLGASGIALIVTSIAVYWCPQCGEYPRDWEGGFNLDPEQCRYCGARLQ